MTWRRWWWLTRGGFFAVGLSVFVFLCAIWQDNPNISMDDWHGDGLPPPDGDITSKLVGTGLILLVLGLIALGAAFLGVLDNDGDFDPPERPRKKDPQATEQN